MLYQCFWTVTVGQLNLNPIVILLVKPSIKIYKSSHNLFIYISFGIQLVNTDGVFLSVYTDKFSDGKIYVSKYYYKIIKKKKPSTKTYTSSHNFFFHILSRIPSVNTNRVFLSVYADGFSDGKIYVSK